MLNISVTIKWSKNWQAYLSGLPANTLFWNIKLRMTRLKFEAFESELNLRPRGLLHNNWLIWNKSLLFSLYIMSVNFFDKFKTFQQILIKDIENKYAIFQMHDLLTQFRPRVRMCACQLTRSNEMLFWRHYNVK